MIFLLFQHITHLLCKDGHFWGEWDRGRGSLHILGWEKSTVTPHGSYATIAAWWTAECRQERHNLAQYWPRMGPGTVPAGRHIGPINLGPFCATLDGIFFPFFSKFGEAGTSRHNGSPLTPLVIIYLGTFYLWTIYLSIYGRLIGPFI